MQPVAAAWRGHAEFGVALRVEPLVGLFSVGPGNRRRLRDPAADGLPDSLMAVPSRSSQTDGRDMRSLTHPHRWINSLSSGELTNG
jgi:hypothetical protein